MQHTTWHVECRRVRLMERVEEVLDNCRQDFEPSEWPTVSIPFRRPARCGPGTQLSPGADVGRANPVPVQMLAGRTQSRCRCGQGKLSPVADVGGASPVPVQMWAGRAQSRCRCVNMYRPSSYPLYSSSRCHGPALDSPMART